MDLVLIIARRMLMGRGLSGGSPTDDNDREELYVSANVLADMIAEALETEGLEIREEPHAAAPQA